MMTALLTLTEVNIAMARFIDKGLVKADDPMYSEGLRIYSYHKFKGSAPILEGLPNLVGEQEVRPLESKEQEVNNALKAKSFRKQQDQQK